MDQAQHFQNLFVKKKVQSKVKTSSSTLPCSSVIIKALSGVYFIHTLWDQTYTYTHTHTRTIAFYKQTTEQRQKDQHMLLYTIHWLNSTLSVDPLLKLGYLKWKYTEGHHFTGLCEGAVYSWTQVFMCLMAIFLLLCQYRKPHQYIRGWKTSHGAKILFVLDWECRLYE